MVILADDLGLGDLSCYNPKGKVPTPNLDKLASEGMRFTDAHTSAAQCSPTRYGLITGQYSWRTRLKVGVLKHFEPPLIDKERLTVASLLKQNGYATAGVGKWHLGWGWVAKAGKKLNRNSWNDKECENVDFTKPLLDGCAGKRLIERNSRLGTLHVLERNIDCHSGRQQIANGVPHGRELSRVACPQREKRCALRGRGYLSPSASRFRSENQLHELNVQRCQAFVKRVAAPVNRAVHRRRSSL